MVKKQTLLEKAKQINYKQKAEVSPEEIELAMAWIRNEVTLTQCGAALGTRASSTASRLAIIIRQAYREGVIKIMEG